MGDTIWRILGVWGIIATVLLVVELTRDDTPDEIKALRAIGEAASEVSAQWEADEKAVEEAMSKPEAVTLAEFQSLQQGMSYQQVVAIVGSEGTLKSENSSSGSGLEYKSYDWENADGSTMSLSFNNGSLSNRYQFGLK
jgi:hypothetical protein